MYSERCEAIESARDYIRYAIEDLKPCIGQEVTRAMLEDAVEELESELDYLAEKIEAEYQREQRALEREYWKQVI